MQRGSELLTGYTLNIFQARLDVSVSSIGTMSPQVLISFEKFLMKTKVAHDMDRLPVWQESFNFERSTSDLELIMIHKPLLLKDVEIGRCKLTLSESSGWFELQKENKKIGSIRLSIREDKDTRSETWHNTAESFDLRDDFIRKMNELELEKEEALFFKRKFKEKLEKTKEKKRRSSGNLVSTGDFTEYTNFESADSYSDEYLMRIQYQVNNLQHAIRELTKKKEVLDSQEKEVSEERKRIEEEWKEMRTKRLAVNEMRKKIEDEQVKVKSEHLKVGSCSRFVENYSNDRKSERDRFRLLQISNRMNGVLSPVTVCRNRIGTPLACQSIEDMQEKVQVNKIPMTVEKSRPPLHPLSGNSSRLISFE